MFSTGRAENPACPFGVHLGLLAGHYPRTDWIQTGEFDPDPDSIGAAVQEAMSRHSDVRSPRVRSRLSGVLQRMPRGTPFGSELQEHRGGIGDAGH